jgi:hypothetical protein
VHRRECGTEPAAEANRLARTDEQHKPHQDVKAGRRREERNGIDAGSNRLLAPPRKVAAMLMAPDALCES